MTTSDRIDGEDAWSVGDEGPYRVRLTLAVASGETVADAIEQAISQMVRYGVQGMTFEVTDTMTEETWVVQRNLALTMEEFQAVMAFEAEIDAAGDDDTQD